MNKADAIRISVSMSVLMIAIGMFTFDTTREIAPFLLGLAGGYLFASLNRIAEHG